MLGRTSGKRKEGKENWWREVDVQEAFRIKKASFRRWSTQRDEQSRMAYKDAKRDTKKMVTKARQERYQKLYDDMLTKKGQKDVFRIAKQRDMASKEVQAVKMMKDEHGRVITSEKVKERWKEYFTKLLNEENERRAR